MNPKIINIKDSVGGLNGRLDTAGKKLVSRKIDWKKLFQITQCQTENFQAVKRHRTQTKI